MPRRPVKCPPNCEQVDLFHATDATDMTSPGFQLSHKDLKYYLGNVVYALVYYGLGYLVNPPSALLLLF